MKSMEVSIDGKHGTGVEVSLPKAPLVLVYGKDGFVMCGFLNIEAAEKMGVAAAVVRGVASVDDLLKGNVSSLTSAAAQKGVVVGMTGREALSKLL